MTSVCNNDLLEKFSLEHYTYINQLFGDLTVREIIQDVPEFHNTKYILDTEKGDEDFEHSFHHIIVKKPTKKRKPRLDDIVCSVENGYQNIIINKNDTLCQSYSLLLYFNIPILNDPANRESHKQNQMNMIAMYRDIIKTPNFLTKMNEILDVAENKHLWIDYTKSTDKKTVFVNMKKTIILKNINKVLDKWEEYGYLYFTGNGKCPAKMRSRIDQTMSTKNNSSLV